MSQFQISSVPNINFSIPNLIRLVLHTQLYNTQFLEFQKMSNLAVSTSPSFPIANLNIQKYSSSNV